MRTYISKIKNTAYFSFIEMIVILSCYKIDNKKTIQKAINWSPEKGQITPEIIEIRSLLKHEYTHFLDMTTTEWGYQYIYRKLRLIEALKNLPDEIEDRKKVFLIDSLELHLHNKFKVTGKISVTDCDELKHELKYNNDFGVYLLVYFYKKDVIQHQVCLSILLLLEANAIASEYISAFNDISFIEDVCIKQIELNERKQKFEDLLDNQNCLEYSLLILLTKKTFNQLETVVLLKLVSALVRFSLNASIIQMSAIANVIEKSITDTNLGKCISMDLRRGQQRCLLYFKMIIFMDGWLKKASENTKKDAIELIVSSPVDFINKFWKDCYCIDSDDMKFDFLCDLKLDNLNKFEITKDAYIYLESFNNNYKKLERKSFGEIETKEIKTLNFLLSDNTEIEYGEPIFVEVEKYVSNEPYHSTFVDLDKILDEVKFSRIHLTPGFFELYV